MTIREVFDSMEYGPALEDSKKAQAWLADHDRSYGHFINGKFTEAKSERSFETENPADRSVLAECALGSAEDVDAAVVAARAAQPAWASLKGTERARYLYAIARHLQKHARMFSVLETLDNGKTIRESRDIDVPLAIRHFYYHAGWASLQEEELSTHEALGVCGQIIPWNFPLLMLAWKIAPAIAMGNTVVIKPAEQTPLTALAFAEICQDVGLPVGVVNIVTGDGSTGAAIVAHSDINKIAFTGSTDIGRVIRKATAGSGKSLTLELGGKSPFIVFDDADLSSAVEGVVDSIWFNQGQVCCAGSRLLVQEGVADVFFKKLKRRLADLRIGNPLDKCVDMGAIVSEEQLHRISGLVSRAAEQGAEVIQAPRPVSNSGHFFPATLVCNVEPTFEIVQEEVFGPVLVAMTFRTPAEAIQIANHSRFGLAASVWSENVNLALDMTTQLEAGVVWVNSANQFDAAAEFGGIKESGYGREGGRDGLLAYLRRKPSVDALPAKQRAARTSIAPESVDRTAKIYVAGKQVRPDSGYSYCVQGHKEIPLGHAGLGSRKDVRDAVEAAVSSRAWSAMHGHGRAQVLYYIAENLAARKGEFADRIASFSGQSGAEEVGASIDMLFRCAAWADKYDGAVRNVNAPGVVLKTNEPIGVIGLVCQDSRPLYGMVELIAPAMAMGNRVVVIPSESSPLAATDFYQVLDASDVPKGAISLVTGVAAELASTLAGHADVGSVWSARTELASDLEELSADNLKRVWLPSAGFGLDEALRHATQPKSVWIPYGE